MDDGQYSNHDDFDLLSFLEDAEIPCIEPLAVPIDELSYVGDVSYADLETPDNAQQSNEEDPMSSELSRLFYKHRIFFEQLDDEESNASNDVSLQVIDDYETSKINHYISDENDRLLGWTGEDNKILCRIIDGALEKSRNEGRSVSWREITEMFNDTSQQKRTKIQLYSHVRYCVGNNRSPCYLKAEEEVMLAFDEIGIPPRYMSKFLVSKRNPNLLAAKLQRLKASNRVQAPEGSRQAAFRKRVQEIVQKNGGLEALKEGRMPINAIQDVRHLVRTNPNLRKRYLALKPAGRPSKKTKIVPVTLQLKMLFKPFVYINKRRKRITCLPGDGRRYGLNLFCLNRLLGSPLEVSKMPDNEEDAIKAGVDKADYLQYAVLRELLLLRDQTKPFRSTVLPPKLLEITGLNPNGAQEDKKYFYSNPDHPPAESILPPTLFSLTGLRGLILYRETLRAIATEECDENDNLLDHGKIGDEEANTKLGLFLESMFQKAFELTEIHESPLDNSDGDSDSDEDICFKEEQPDEDQIVTANQDNRALDQGDVAVDGPSAVDTGIDELLNSEASQDISPEMANQLMEAFQLLANDQSINFHVIESSLLNIDSQ